MFLSSTSPATSSRSIWLSCSHLITYELKSILKGPSAPKRNVSMNIFFLNWVYMNVLFMSFHMSYGSLICSNK